MKVSVIVTTYNRPSALVRVLDGLLAQTRLPDEILIADDGSGGETREAIAPYLDAEGPVVRHIWQADKGFRAAKSRNRAILAASGEYLVFLDGDCIPGPWFIADHADLAAPGRFFQGKRVLVGSALCDTFNHRDTASFTGLAALALSGKIANAHHILRLPFFPCRKSAGLSGVRSCNMGVFKGDVEAVNGFNHDFEGWGREDSEFVARLLRYGILRNENPFRAICYHLWHPENTRDRLDANDNLLSSVRSSGIFYCERGLDSLKNEDEDIT